MNKTPKINNPITNEPVSKGIAKLIHQAREARRGARKEARSGNPAKRFPALKALKDIPDYIRALYVQDARSAK